MVRWIVGAGAFVVSLDSMVNVAFPAMAAALAVPPEAMRWVVIGYVLTYALTALAGGAAADRIGYRPVFRAGLALSAAGFLAAGAAPTFGLLLVGRVLQGLGGGLVYGTAPGLVTLGTPPAARGRRLGFLNAAMGGAFAVGPLVAGLLVDWAGWRVIFHVRVPLALLALGWALRGLPAAASSTAAPGPVGGREARRGAVVAAGALAFVAQASIFAIWLLAPFYLAGIRGLDAPVAGLLFTLTPLGTTVAAPLAGRVSDRSGPRWPVAVGLGLEAAGLLVLGSAHRGTPPMELAFALFVAGFGVGFFQVPNMAAIMAGFPPTRQGMAGGLAFLARTLGVVAGVLALATFFAWRRTEVGFDAAYAEAFLAAALAVGVASALAVLAPPPRRVPSAR